MGLPRSQQHSDIRSSDPVRRPLVGFLLVGWFPLDEFAACGNWRDDDYLTPDMIDPEAFVPDHLRLVREGEWMDDDIIRGACHGCEIAGKALQLLPDQFDRCIPGFKILGKLQIRLPVDITDRDVLCAILGVNDEDP